MKNFKINKKDEIKIIKIRKKRDFRGYFRRLFCADELNKIVDKKITQVNHSFTKKKGTIRGLHYQVKPFEEIKIILCIKGKIFDVMVNMNKRSKNYLKKKYTLLDSKHGDVLIVPKKFAHGFQTLEKNTELIYFVTKKYNKEFEKQINPFDPKLKIKWPHKLAQISKKDKLSKYIK